MQPGVVFNKDYAPETPDPKEQKVYRSFVAKTQFVANWIRYDIFFAASQLARFCASACVYWAALHHLMGYLHSNPSFKLLYQLHNQRGNYNGLDCYIDSDWGNSESRWSTPGLLARKVLASINMKNVCNMLCGKGWVRTQDLGHQAERCAHCAARQVGLLARYNKSIVLL